jgi:hypothetical protein
MLVMVLLSFELDTFISHNSHILGNLKNVIRRKTK